MHLARYVWSAVILVAPSHAWGFVAGRTGFATRLSDLSALRSRISGQSGRIGLCAKKSPEAEAELVKLADLWRMRETMARTSFTNLAKYKLSELDDAADAAADAAANPAAAAKGATLDNVSGVVRAHGTHKLCVALKYKNT